MIILCYSCFYSVRCIRAAIMDLINASRYGSFALLRFPFVHNAFLWNSVGIQGRKLRAPHLPPFAPSLPASAGSMATERSGKKLGEVG